MKTNWKTVVLALMVAFLGGGIVNARAQQADWSQSGNGDRDHRELHIQHTVTTSQINFPQSLFMYHVLDGANSTGEVHGLRGTISLTNHGSEFSEVLWELAYWQGQCPVDDQSLAGANIFWTEIQKNPAKSEVTLPVDLHFPYPLPMTGCIGFIFAGGPLVKGAAAVTMSADLHLEYRRSDATANAVVGLAGEYCFGQNWGCQNATTDDADGFAVPIQVPAGHLVELYGDISDSTFDGTDNFGPLPKGQVWGATNDIYLLRGGCGQFGANLNSQGFPNPVLLATLRSWLPHDALHLLSVPLDYQIPPGGSSKAPLTMAVEALLPYPVKVHAGDCVVVIYGRKGNGATDNESQINAVLTP
jgi:hypothetical protein